MIATRRIFSTRDELAAALAADVAARLADAIAARGDAVLAVSGGTTPKLLFPALSKTEIDWPRVTVTLVDERWVDETSDRSNARLVRESLLQNQAASARFVPLYRNEAEAAALDTFAVTLLGMGTDGHTASFFPGGDTLDEALDLKSGERILKLEAAGAGETRVTFTLPALVESDFLALHIEGEEKRATLDRAEGDGPVEDMPIRAFLRAAAPVTLYWSP
ncbi:MAG: 6-phosphogluconolactonase [Parvibaculaceae bacterium]